MIKVAIYLGSQPPEVGGGFTFIDEVLNALLKLGSVNYRFCAAAGDERWRPRIESAGWEFLTLPPPEPTAEDSLWAAYGAPKLRRYLGQPEPLTRRQVMSDAGVQLLLNFSPFETASFDVPYINIVWDLQHRLQPMFPEVSSGPIWEYRERHCRPLLQRASIVIVGTEAGQDEVMRFYGVPPERIRRLPHPTPAFALESDSAEAVDPFQRFGLPPEYVFYPAQFWAHKNHHTLLLAVRELKESHGRKIALAFSGSDKGNRAYLEKCAEELGVRDQVFFLGFVERAELIGLYRNALALAYLSFFGPENLPPLEAFGLGCPVIAARVPGAEEQLADAAVLVEPTDASAVAAALQRMFTEPQWRVDLIERGRVRARRFTPADFAMGLVEIFDHLSRYRRCWA